MEYVGEILKMGARAITAKVELSVSSDEFNRRVGLISNFYELEWLGLNGHDFSGVFTIRDLPSLIEFCRVHRNHHILTLVGPGRMLNRLVEGGNFFMIGNGDKDPGLLLNYLLDPLWPVAYEDGINSALTELDNIKNRSD